MNHQAENPALQVFDCGSQKEATDDSIPAKNTKQQTRTKSPETPMDEKQIESHHNRDTITVFHQQHYKDRNLLSPANSNANMITIPTSAIDAEQGEPTDTRDTTLKENQHSNKTRKPKHNMNQATMMDAPCFL